ncbi:MAG TPA: signal peptidase I [Candidatus Saccharimonas sp.]|nr:signal peptidase I [Candidatus Saccharimonas sp.]
MNPQSDNVSDELKPGLSRLPQVRASGQLNVPMRGVQELHDIDDSAFSENTKLQQQNVPQLPVAVEQVVTPKPPTTVTSPAQPVAVQPPVQQPLPQPVTTTPQPTGLAAVPPMPVTPVEPPPIPQPKQAPQPTQATPVAFQPPATQYAQHTQATVIERIDEKPQQNSRDIEALIDHNHRIQRLKTFASFLAFAAGVVVAAFLINQFVFQSYYVDGTSMTPTLQNDDRLIIDKVEHTIANLQGHSYVPQRGQIVVLDSSIVGLNGHTEQLVKRVIGLPGDTVSINNGVVTIKNKENPNGFDASKQLGLTLQPTFVDSPQEWTIDDSHVFVMGDNRVENGSYDSRAFGPVETDKIVGRLWARILPFDKAQIF